jgi:hypothetical protein
MNLELLLRHYRDHVRRPRAQASRERERFVPVGGPAGHSGVRQPSFTRFTIKHSRCPRACQARRHYPLDPRPS